MMRCARGGVWTVLTASLFVSVCRAGSACEEAQPPVEQQEVGVNHANIVYEGPDREVVIATLAHAFERYASRPRTHGGMPTFTSLAAHSQEHILDVSWEGAQLSRLRVHTYPAASPSWEVSFMVDATGDIVDIMVAFDEEVSSP